MRGVLPKDKKDVAVQLSLFAACYLGYQVVRGQVDGAVQDAFWNASQVISLESSMNFLVEPAIQNWARSQDWIIGFANWMYLNSHYLITVSVLVWIYLKRNLYFCTIRNSFIAAMVIALFGYILVPTAPPRMMPEWGFSDTIAQATGIHAETSSVGGMVNFYAAVPSMHVCFALLVGGWMSYLSQRKIARWMWRFYPLLITWVVIATGNHYLLDAILGAATALGATIFSLAINRTKLSFLLIAK